MNQMSLKVKQITLKITKDPRPFQACVEASLLIAGTNIPSTEIRTEYKWESWDKPNHYCIKAKKGFRYYRSAFHQINGYEEIEITDDEIEELSEYYYNEYEIISYITIHRTIVLISLQYFDIAG